MLYTVYTTNSSYQVEIDESFGASVDSFLTPYFYCGCLEQLIIHLIYLFKQEGAIKIMTSKQHVFYNKNIAQIATRKCFEITIELLDYEYYIITLKEHRLIESLTNNKIKTSIFKELWHSKTPPHAYSLNKEYQFIENENDSIVLSQQIASYLYNFSRNGLSSKFDLKFVNDSYYDCALELLKQYFAAYPYCNNKDLIHEYFLLIGNELGYRKDMKIYNNEKYRGLIYVGNEYGHYFVRTLERDDKLTFGKYKGYKIGIVAAINAEYLLWCEVNIDTFHMDFDMFPPLDVVHLSNFDEAFKIFFIKDSLNYQVDEINEQLFGAQNENEKEWYD